jgi:hypothetical protein
MSTDPVAAYQEARNRLRKAEVEAARLAKFIAEAGKKLADDGWKEVILNGCNFSFGASSGLRAGSSPSINMELWPTAERLGEALTEYHKAKSFVDSAWNALPPDRRSGISPPQ